MESKTKKKVAGAIAGGIAAAGAVFSIKLMDVDEEEYIDDEIEIVPEETPLETVPEILPEPLHDSSTDAISQSKQKVAGDAEPEDVDELDLTGDVDEVVAENNTDEDSVLMEYSDDFEDTSICSEDLIPVIDVANEKSHNVEESNDEIDVTYDYDDSEREDTETGDGVDTLEEEPEVIQEDAFEMEGNCDGDLDSETVTSESDSEIEEYDDLLDLPSDDMDIDPIAKLFITV